MPTEKKNAPKSVKSENRRRRYENRRKMEEKLGRKLKSNEAVHHKPDGSLTVVDKASHGAKHGRGNKGKAGTYVKSAKQIKKKK
jgi:hypothetical protein